MKKLIIGTSLALATLAAAPAFANSSHHSRVSAAPTTTYSGTEAYAASPGYIASPQVIFDNKVVGQDPDPNVRLQLYRDPGLLAN